MSTLDPVTMMATLFSPHKLTTAQSDPTQDPKELEAYKYFEIFAVTEAIALIVSSVVCLVIIRQHTPYMVCYQIIGLVLLSNIAYLLNQTFIQYLDQKSTEAQVLEAVCSFFSNCQTLISILFVRKQWMTTRKQLYRQAVTKDSKEFFRKQVVRHRWYFFFVQVFFVLFLALAATATYTINKQTIEHDDCFIDQSKCKGFRTFGVILTTYLISTILKNLAMSLILFWALYKFYKQLKQIGLKFTVGRCNLCIHIGAFGLPVISGCIYIICITKFNQVAMFTSKRATAHYWNVLGPTMLYDVTMGLVQLLQLILITNYSIKASGRNLVTSNSDKHNSGNAQQYFDEHIDKLIRNYRNSVISKQGGGAPLETQDSEEIMERLSLMELNDQDFQNNRDKEEDRKFNDIMKLGVSLDNQIMCQFARIDKESISFYTTCRRVESMSRSQSVASAELFTGNAINADEIDSLDEGVAAVYDGRSRSLSSSLPKHHFRQRSGGEQSSLA